MDSPIANGFNLKDRIALYKQFDHGRQQELELLAERVSELQSTLETTKGDLEDEQTTRRAWRRRAEEAEMAVARNQFVLVLVDGDGYIFKQAFLKDAAEAGGAHAAHQLYSEVQNYVRANKLIDASSEIDVVVNVYANKTGLAKALYESGMLPATILLEQFFCSFTQSRSLFQFVDCGPGKERTDAKLRDTYRFYAYNAHCRHVFLACCHDNGYVAELDKFRHDSIAAPKTTLVHAAQPAREYANLPFPIARFGSVFETSAIAPRQQVVVPKPQYPQPHLLDGPSPEWPSAPHVEPESAAANRTTYSAVTSPPTVTAAPPPTRSTSVPQSEVSIKTAATTTTAESTPKPATGDPRGIPINRAGQRIDRRMRLPSTPEQERFDARIRYRKLCNEHHLRDSCFQYNCKYDHDPIDSDMKNTLRHMARRIPCSTGMKCRRADCYYGHQCPWGSDTCTNPKCAFIKAGLHDITDLEVSKFVAPTPGS